MKKVILSICVILLLIINVGIFSTLGISYSNNFSEINSKDGKHYAVIYIGRYFPRLDFNQSHWGPEGNWENLEIIQQYYTWYLKDAARMYNMLKEDYIYTDENIILLVNTLPDFIKVPLNETDEDGKTIWKRFFDMPENFKPNWIDTEYDTDESGLKTVLEDFKPAGKNPLEENDSLFVCYINHGGEAKNEDGTKNTYFGCSLDEFRDLVKYFTYIFSLIENSDLKLVESFQKLFEYFKLDEDPEIIFDYEFADYVEDIKAKMIFALQPCKSGGFIEELSKENRIILTAMRENQSSGLGWLGPFRKGLEGPESDYNNDGNISILEAYKYAALSVDSQEEQKPNNPMDALIDDNGDGIGHHYLEEGYFENSEDGCSSEPIADGCMANHTYLYSGISEEKEDTESSSKETAKVNSNHSTFYRFIKIFKDILKRYLS